MPIDVPAARSAGVSSKGSAKRRAPTPAAGAASRGPLRRGLGAACACAVLLVGVSCGEADPPAPVPAAGPPATAPAEVPEGGPEAPPGRAHVRVRELATRAERYTGALGHFLNTGPSEGTWSVQKPNRIQTWIFAPHPTETEAMLVADVDETGARRGIEVVHRGAVPRLFFEAPSWLFFANYAIDGEPVLAPLEGTAAAVLVTWRPVHDGGGLTERRAWFDRDTAELLQIEDRSRTGHVMRAVRRHPGAASAIQLPSGEDAGCCGRPLANVAADDIRRALMAPFSIYEPAVLPHGFVRIRADYRASAIEDAPEAAPIHFATLLYSDGLALLSLVIAPRPDMNAIMAQYGRMPARAGDPDSCPGLPKEVGEVHDARAVVRMRSDICRTVLRRDDVAEDLSVMLMGRNELSLDTYVRAISGLRPVTGP